MQDIYFSYIFFNDYTMLFTWYLHDWYWNNYTYIDASNFILYIKNVKEFIFTFYKNTDEIIKLLLDIKFRSNDRSVAN